MFNKKTILNPSHYVWDRPRKDCLLSSGM